MKLAKITFTSGAALLLSACVTHDPLAVNVHRDGSLTLHSTSAAVQGTVVRTDQDGRIICKGPPPDASISEDSSGSFSFSLVDIGDKTTDAIGSGETEDSLGGRNPNVLITREILYRQCEFLGNSKLTDDQKLKLFQDTLSALVQINQTSLGDSTGTTSTALPALEPLPSE